MADEALMAFDIALRDWLATPGLVRRKDEVQTEVQRPRLRLVRPNDSDNVQIDEDPVPF